MWHLGDRRGKAPTALPRRQVRGAPRHAVDVGVSRVEGDGPGYELSRRVHGGNVLRHAAEELVDGCVEPADEVGGYILGVVELHLLVLRVRGGDEQVSIGEADEAGVVEDGDAFVIGAELLRVGESGGDAGVASGGVLVAAAYPDGVDLVRRRAGPGDGEESGGRGDVGRQGRGDQAEIGLVGAVRRVVSRRVAAYPPRHTSRQRRQGNEQAGNRDGRGMVAHAHHGAAQVVTARGGVDAADEVSAHTNVLILKR